MDRACLEYGVRAGLIFCLAREFPLELNEILVKKAVKYKNRGVVGIDLAGPEQHTLELGAEVTGYRDLFARARAGVARRHRPHRRDAATPRCRACWRC
jgi:adenosine deaminase